MKRTLPLALTTLRLLLGPVVLGCARSGAPDWVYAPMLVAATLSDIFDGILARRFGVATARLRRYDSITDVIYYLFVLDALWVLRRDLVKESVVPILWIVLSEVFVIAVSYIRFRKYPAAHTYLAKFYGLCLLGAFIGLLSCSGPRWIVVALAAVAVLTNAEILAIHWIADSPPVDVRSLLALLRRS
jgi:CDP-diacylglycerol---glycerol-3-phosphate 3-phosphatidyltransferase